MIIYRTLLSALALAALASLGACGGSDDNKGSDQPTPVQRPTPAPPGAPWETLAEWNLFSDIPNQVPSAGVLPYDVISVLYADDAEKHRFLFLPEGAQIAWKDTERWQLPVGAILVKTFSYLKDARDPSLGQRLLETRLLVHEPSEWIAHIYVYDEAQQQAVRVRSGRTIDVSHIDATGATREEQYNVPSEFDCQSCHGKRPEMHPLGPRTRQLDRLHDYGDGPVNQIDHLAELGAFDVTPPSTRVHLTDPFGDGPLVERARSYLDANCSHCHEEGGRSDSTGLWLNYERTDPVTGDPHYWGECKFPTSAGKAAGNLDYDVVPGNADASILTYRVGSAEPKVKMPPLLTRHPDARGLQVLRDWINAMPLRDCKAQ